MSVLLIDDQPMIGEAVRRMLAGEAGFSFHFCSAAREAIQAAADIAPTVILQDLVMPEIDGLELVSMFRADERFRDIPIIVLSAKEEAAVKAELREEKLRKALERVRAGGNARVSGTTAAADSRGRGG